MKKICSFSLSSVLVSDFAPLLYQNTAKMGSRWLSTAFGVVGVICALTSEVVAEQSAGEEYLEMYLKIVGEGETVGRDCSAYNNGLTDDTIPQTVETYAGWSASQIQEAVEKSAREEKSSLEELRMTMRWILQDIIDKTDRCLLKEALVCDEKEGKCVSCRDPGRKHKDCENAIKIADAESKREEVKEEVKDDTTDSTEKPQQTQTGSGTGRLVLPVGGTLLAGLNALRSQVFL